MRVLLVCMPFADVGRPAVGVSLLQAELEAAGISCEVLYPNLTFARLIGLPEYRFVDEHIPWRAMATEWVFARALYGSFRGDERGYVDDVLLRTWNLSPVSVQRLLEVREQAQVFVDQLLADVAWTDYDVVAFTSYCGQNLASLALAQRIKQAHPRIAIVFGGRNWDGEMGRELHRLFPFVDFAFSGEADISFPALVRALQDRGSDAACDIGGVVYRSKGRSRSAGAAATVSDLDSLPVPDFDDYFAQLRGHGYARQFVPALAMESSRGCWWAARRPCGFCGLNGVRTTYRSKSPERFLSESRLLAAKYPASCLDLVDMVVSPGFLSGVLPKLAAEPLPVPLFIQVRATLSLEELRLVKRAGVELQCGIESLSDHVLTLVGKGTTTLENFRFLKWCRALGLEPAWPMLYGFPQESDEDYGAICDLLPSLHFMQPPSELESVLVPRFSPFFSQPSRYGLHALRPLAPYAHLYPFPTASLKRIALFFDADAHGAGGGPAYLPRLREAYGEWRAEHAGSGEVRGVASDAGLTLHDTRSVAATPEMVLDGCDEAIYRACDGIATTDELTALVLTRFPDCAESLDERLARLVRQKVMLRSDERYLSLALLDQAE